jgi:predicted aldo/keto reductase-like oxidoreductase
MDTSVLGRTGLKVTRFSAGGHFTYGPSSHEDIPRRIREINHILDLGVNYLDVQWEPEEEATAEVMKTRKKEFSVAWPLHGVTKLGGEVTEDYILKYCQDHRKRYHVDHVEILLWIGLELHPQSEDRVMEQVGSAAARLKADGFCDFFGFSCHHSPEMAQHAFTKFKVFDVMMVPYCALHPAAGNGLFKAARAAGVGTVGMKPFGGGGGFLNAVWSGAHKHPRTEGLLHHGRPYQAALRWAYRNQDVDCFVPGMHSITQIDQLHEALQKPYDEEDERILRTLREVMDETHAECQLRKEGLRPDSWG